MSDLEKTKAAFLALTPGGTWKASPYMQRRRWDGINVVDEDGDIVFRGGMKRYWDEWWERISDIQPAPRPDAERVAELEREVERLKGELAKATSRDVIFIDPGTENKPQYASLISAPVAEGVRVWKRNNADCYWAWDGKYMWIWICSHTYQASWRRSDYATINALESNMPVHELSPTPAAAYLKEHPLPKAEPCEKNPMRELECENARLKAKLALAKSEPALKAGKRYMLMECWCFGSPALKLVEVGDGK